MAKMKETEAHPTAHPAPQLQVTRVRVAELQLNERMLRRHEQESVAAIGESLGEFGPVQPLVVQKSRNWLIAGNGRVMAMRKAGTEWADVVMLDIDDVRAQALAIALNRTQEKSSWDDPALAETLQAIMGAGVRLETVGYNEIELGELYERPDVETADKEAKVKLHKSRTNLPPPAMAWVLIGVPLVEYGRIDGIVRKIAEMPGVLCEVSSSDEDGS